MGEDLTVVQGAHCVRWEEFCCISEGVHSRLELFDDVCDRCIMSKVFLHVDAK